jgi:integrating conjugative element protein (TIGR03761 family)
MDDQKSQSGSDVSVVTQSQGESVDAGAGADVNSKSGSSAQARARGSSSPKIIASAKVNKAHGTGSVVNSEIFAGLVSSDDETEVDSAKSKWNRPGMSDGVVRGNQAVPKAMQMGASMKLHSHLAINMFRGRRGDLAKGQRPIIGLARFARQVSLVWSAAEQDDPYADQSLIEVERFHNETKKILSGREKTLGELISGMEGLTVGLQTSTQPAAIDLQFYCPWSYRAALLLLQFDRIVRLGLTAKHVGFIGDEEWKGVVSDSGRALRHLFAIPNHWINTGATRDDLRKNTKVAKRAIAMYNDVKEGRLVLSEDVLSGNTRAALAPQNRALEKFLAKSKQEVATN